MVVHPCQLQLALVEPTTIILLQSPKIPIARIANHSAWPYIHWPHTSEKSEAGNPRRNVVTHRREKEWGLLIRIIKRRSQHAPRRSLTSKFISLTVLPEKKELTVNYQLRKGIRHRIILRKKAVQPKTHHGAIQANGKIANGSQSPSSWSSTASHGTAKASNETW